MNYFFMEGKTENKYRKQWIMAMESLKKTEQENIVRGKHTHKISVCVLSIQANHSKDKHITFPGWEGTSFRLKLLTRWWERVLLIADVEKAHWIDKLLPKATNIFPTKLAL